MTPFIPFTYTITYIPEGLVYYGVRFNRRACYPKQLGKTYFSSSTVVKNLITLHGIEKFKFEVRRTFTTAEQAQLWEAKVLRRLDAMNHPKMLNKKNSHENLYSNHSGHRNPAYGKPGTMLGKKHRPETIEKMIASNTGPNNGFFGKHHTKETVEKIKLQKPEDSKKFKGYYHSPIGKFASCRQLAKVSKISRKALLKWYTNPNLKISKLAVSKCDYLKPEHIGKTFRDIGFFFEPQ